jgi:hypothetical protein
VTKPSLTLIAYGLDPDGQPRAGRFDDADAALALNAAAALGYCTGRVPRALAKRLPAGNVFAPGSRFVHRISRSKFAELSILLDG